ncbi:MAG: hypothetical protein ACLTBV_19475 [Enterocloster bolteae]
MDRWYYFDANGQHADGHGHAGRIPGWGPDGAWTVDDPMKPHMMPITR